MNLSLADAVAGVLRWIGDFYLLATLSLGLALVAGRWMRQPARRLTLAWTLLIGLVLLAAICAMPRWPRVSLGWLAPADRADRAEPIAATPIMTEQKATEPIATPPIVSEPAATDADAAEPPRRQPAAPPRDAPLGSHDRVDNPTSDVATDEVHSNEREPITEHVSTPTAVVSHASQGGSIRMVPASVAGLFVLGSCLAAAWLAWGALASMRLCRRASLAPAALMSELACIVGAARRPRLLLSRRVGSPAALGLFRPTIILPATVVEGEVERDSPGALRAVLAHEWAHIRNRDLWLLALGRGLLPLLFAHPLFWWLRRKIRDDQELVADAVAAQDDRPDYAAQLLRWVRREAGPAPRRIYAALGIWERPSQLSRRIAMLLDDNVHVQIRATRRWRIGTVGAVAVVGLALSMLTLQAAPPDPPIAASSAVTADEPTAGGDVDPLPPGALTRLGRSRFVVGGVIAMDFSPDGAALAVVATDPQTRSEAILKVFDTHTGIPTWQGSWTSQSQPAGDNLLSYSKNGKQLWSGGVEWTVGSWTSAERSLPGTLDAVSADHRWAAVWNVQPPRLIVWDVDAVAAAATITLSGQNNRIQLAAFSDDGKTLAISTSQNQWLLYDVPSGKLLHDLSDAVGGGARMAFSLDGKLFATTGNGADVLLFDVASGRPTRTCQPSSAFEGIGAIRFTPDGHLLAADASGNKIHILDPNTGETTGAIAIEGRRGIANIAVSRDGRFLAVATDDAEGLPLRVFDWKTRQEVLPPTGARSTVTHLAYSPNGRQLAAGSVDGQIQLWDPPTGKLSIKLSADSSSGLQFSADGWALGALGPAGSYHLWSTDAADDLAQRAASEGSRYPYGPLGVALAPELNDIAQGDAAGRVEVLATATGVARRPIAAYKDGVVAAVGYSRDGQIIATARGDAGIPGQPRVNSPPSGRESIQLWDAASAQPIKSLVSTLVVDPQSGGGREGGFAEIAFSPDGSLLAAVHSSGIAVIWDIASGKQFFEFNLTGPFCFSSDGKWLIRGEGATAEMIELASGQTCFHRKSSTAPDASADLDPNARQRRMIEPTGVTALAIAPDDRTFAAALADDNSVLIWSLSPEVGVATNPKQPPTDAELGRLWDALAGVDAPAAYGAIWRLQEGGDATVEFIRRRFGPIHASAADARRIRRLIGDLDNNVWDVRDRASTALKAYGSSAGPLLRETLSKQPSPETRTRSEALLAILDSPIQRFGGDTLRHIRSIQVVERIETKQATELLESIAAGDPPARETKDAKAALERRRARAKGR